MTDRMPTPELVAALAAQGYDCPAVRQAKRAPPSEAGQHLRAAWPASALCSIGRLSSFPLPAVPQPPGKWAYQAQRRARRIDRLGFKPLAGPVWHRILREIETVLRRPTGRKKACTSICRAADRSWRCCTANSARRGCGPMMCRDAALLAAMCQSMSPTGAAIICKSTLTAKAGHSHATTKRALRRLAADGLIAKFIRHSKYTGRNAANRYVIAPQIRRAYWRALSFARTLAALRRRFLNGTALSTAPSTASLSAGRTTDPLISLDSSNKSKRPVPPQSAEGPAGPTGGGLPALHGTAQLVARLADRLQEELGPYFETRRPAAWFALRLAEQLGLPDSLKDAVGAADCEARIAQALAGVDYAALAGMARRAAAPIRSWRYFKTALEENSLQMR